MTAIDGSACRIAAGAESEPARFGHRAVLISGGVGFLLGILVAAAFVPMLKGTTAHGGRVTIPTPVPYSIGQIRAEVLSLSDAVLGRFSPIDGGSGPKAGQHRLLSVTVNPALPFRYPGVAHALLYNLRIRFLLNPNVFGGRIQTGEAESDCFLLLQSLYSHDLPIQTIDLYGLFQFPGRTHEQTVLHAGSDLSIEHELGPWSSLTRSRYAYVWTHLRPYWISPRFTAYRP